MVFFFPRKFIKPIFVETPYVADRASAKYSYMTYFGGIRFEIAYNIFSTTWVCKYLVLGFSGMLRKAYDLHVSI